MTRYLKISLLLATLALSGCSYLHVYKLDNQQGNIITTGMLQQIKLGMTKEQVQYIMGNAVLDDPFTSNRWDYMYYFKPAYGSEISTRRVSFIFKGDTLTQIIGPVQTGPQDSTPQKSADLSEQMYPPSPWKKDANSGNSLPVPFSND